MKIELNGTTILQETQIICDCHPLYTISFSGDDLNSQISGNNTLSFIAPE